MKVSHKWSHDYSSDDDDNGHGKSTGHSKVSNYENGTEQDDSHDYINHSHWHDHHKGAPLPSLKGNNDSPFGNYVYKPAPLTCSCPHF